MARPNTTGYRYVIRFKYTKYRTSASGESRPSRTVGYQVSIRIGDPDKPLKCSKFFSDLKSGSRKAALIAAIRHRNRFLKANGCQPVK